mgnify:FL=1
MIFVDSNIPMYLVGAPPPLTDAAGAAIERCVSRGERMVTSAEVMQEILHRFVAIKHPEAIQAALDVLAGVVDTVLPIEAVDVTNARDVLLSRARLSARDALHVAVMKRHGIERVMSFDAAFDAVGWIERVY